MRALAAVVAALALLALPAAAPAAQPRTTLHDVEQEVMCVECGTPLEVSQSPVADQERALIRRLIAEGRTKDEIKAALVEEYGRNVLAEPDDGGVGIAAWWIPVVLVPLGLLVALMLARRWRRRSGPAEDAAAPAALAPEDQRRLDADLAAFDR